MPKKRPTSDVREFQDLVAVSGLEDLAAFPHPQSNKEWSCLSALLSHFDGKGLKTSGRRGTKEGLGSVWIFSYLLGSRFFNDLLQYVARIKESETSLSIALYI